ncbi:MAG: hypothetical protein NTV23_12920 [Propionibacteriales bacterium]|nr:hypothetical protein [Propionibacteriales bacterium]
MCRAVRCRTCDKTTWSGCGAHVAQVKARVPADQWCTGHQSTTADTGTTTSWLRRIIGSNGGER